MAGDYGPSLVDGRIQYYSATSLTTGDGRQYGGCEQRWVFKYREKRPEPFTAANALGVEAHDQLREFLSTGRMVLGPVALSMRPFLPAPGPDLRVEQEIGGVPVEGPLRPDEGRRRFGAWLELDGVPLVGQIDLEHTRAVAMGDAESIVDPPHTVTVHDHKTSSSLDYAKTGPELIKTVQMVTYGEAVARRREREGERVDFVRLSHLTGRTKGARAARPASKRHTRAEIAAAWEQIVPVGRRLQELAAGAEPQANKQACGAYRGCPHRAYCPAHNQDVFADLYGDSDDPFTEEETSGTLDATKETTMNILEALNPAVLPAAPPPTVAIDQKAALLAQLAALEAASAPAPVTPPAAPAVPPEVVAAFGVIQRAVMPADKGGGSIGMPPLAGEAAAAWAAIQTPPVIVPPGGTTFPGSGHAARMPARTTLADVLSLAEQLLAAGRSTASPVAAPAPQAPAPVATPAGLLPPDAPASNPALAALPVEGFAPGGAPVLTQAGATPIAGSDAGTAAPVADKPKRGRPPKAKPAPRATTGTDDSGAQVVTGDALELYVNAIPSRPFEDLAVYVRALCADLAQRAGLSDVRLGLNDHPLAFGRWRGALYTAAQKSPPAPGTYVILNPDELAEPIVAALAGLADECVRGVR